jgi:rubredoxin
MHIGYKITLGALGLLLCYHIVSYHILRNSREKKKKNVDDKPQCNEDLKKISSQVKERKHETSPKKHTVITATKDWTEIPSGSVCPSGCEYKMDFETGKNYIRILE